MQVNINNLVVYRIEYIVKTPLIIGNGKKYYLSGNSIRGAILTQLHRSKKFDVKNESTHPTIVFHPAFPVDKVNNKEVVFKPAHPLVFECKICGKKEDLLLSVRKKLDEESLYSILPYTLKDDKDHLFTIKSIGGMLVAEMDNKLYKYNNKVITLNSIGMNKILGSNEINMIYSYSCIPSNTKFNGLIVQSNQNIKLDKMLEEINNTIFLGRGIVRGFGRIELKIMEESKYVDTRRKELQRLIRDDYPSTLLLKTLSPSFNIDITDEKGLITNMDIKLRSSKINIKSSSIISSTHTKVSGFSLLSNMQKISLIGIGEGSIISLGVEGKRDDLIDQSIEWELLGIGQFSYNGFNIVEVIR